MKLHEILLISKNAQKCFFRPSRPTFQYYVDLNYDIRYLHEDCTGLVTRNSAFSFDFIDITCDDWELVGCRHSQVKTVSSCQYDNCTKPVKYVNSVPKIMCPDHQCVNSDLVRLPDPIAAKKVQDVLLKLAGEVNE